MLLQVIDVKWFTDRDTQFKVPDEGDCERDLCYADCGPRAQTPCLKWHRYPVPLTALRAKAHLTPVQPASTPGSHPVRALDSGLEALCALIDRAGQKGRARGRVFGGV